MWFMYLLSCRLIADPAIYVSEFTGQSVCSLYIWVRVLKMVAEPTICMVGGYLFMIYMPF